jgi:hypothetical protein
MKVQDVISIGDLYKAVGHKYFSKKPIGGGKYRYKYVYPEVVSGKEVLAAGEGKPSQAALTKVREEKKVEKTLWDHLNRAKTEIKEKFGKFDIEPSHGGHAVILKFKDGAKALAHMSGRTKDDKLLIDTEWRSEPYVPKQPTFYVKE